MVLVDGGDLRGRTKCLVSSLAADTEEYSLVVLLLYMYISLQSFLKICYSKDFFFFLNN